MFTLNMMHVWLPAAPGPLPVAKSSALPGSDWHCAAISGLEKRGHPIQYTKVSKEGYTKTERHQRPPGEQSSGRHHGQGEALEQR